MATLVEFRAKNPEYNDMPDVALADAMHSKFYADIPKPQFYKQLGLGAETQIPGGETATTLPPKPVTMRDRIMGVVETPAIIAGNVGRMIAAPIAKYGTEAVVGWNTPEGMKQGQQAAQTTSNQFYQPRTETGSDIVGSMAKVLGAIPPTPLTSAGVALSTLAGPALTQTARAIQPAMQTATQTPAMQKMAALLKPPEKQMVGMGAASTDEVLLRQQRAQAQGIPLTKGEQLQDFGLMKRESDLPKENPDLAKGLIEFKAGQKQAIIKRFEQMADETGAVYAASIKSLSYTYTTRRSNCACGCARCVSSASNH